MGINSSLRSFLQSLCCNSPWNYAVFWKLKHQNEMILVWEDGFCDIPKPRNPMVCSIEGFFMENSNTILSSDFIPSVLDGNPGDPVGLAVTEMSSASHVVGNGVVGKAALTGNALWTYSDNVGTEVIDSVLVPEYPYEWLLQFAAGIKTVLLLPVIPHGVLQLGSVELVAEDKTVVASIKAKFETHQISNGYNQEPSIQQLSCVSSFKENLEESLTITKEKENDNQKNTHAIRTKDSSLFANQMIPVSTVQDLWSASQWGVTDTLENAFSSEISWQSLGMFDGPEPCQLSCEGDKSVLIENNILESFNLDEKVRPFTSSDNSNWRMYGDFANELMDFPAVEGASEPNFVGNDFDNAICESESNFFSFPWDSELQKAFGQSVISESNHFTYDSSISCHNMAYSSIHDRDPSYSVDMSGVESAGITVKENEVENLLASLITNACSSSDDNSSEKSNLISSKILSSKHLASSKRPSQPKRSASPEGETIPWSFLTSSFISQGRNVSCNFSAQVTSVGSKVSELDDNLKQRKGYDSLNPVKVSRLPTTNKRRVRALDNQKPRPRDRQLIQDRIKELRDLVPDSEKCSIDGLLDKTIKHMHFLRSVTDQADKLRHQDLKEEADEKITKTAEVNCSPQNGKSWAVELGGEQQLCPIVVKDLDHPGHMLIEMLCTDHFRFLEIADVIYRLQLTILKGVMEDKSDNSWARFVVQASGSFHRLDIFWPLMQLLQQSRTLVSGKI
ncbi:hypothetical protein ACJIZ3_024079 [Penstemon smallii]|uniref:BHLH domain-containing protein n=1 Tax=Penstemon smallii TaxID=265156 RepID=A0ABD3TTA9_9LAMI